MSRKILSMVALSAAMIAGACYEDDVAPLNPGAGLRTQILLTDAPFPYDTVARVDIYIVSIAASTGSDTTEQPGGAPWEIVAEPRQRYNLLDLQRGVTDTVGTKTLPLGEYRSVRMVIDTDSSSITSKNGSELPVNWGSSAGQPKLYALVEGYNTVSGDSARIVIDFDVGRSFWPIEGGNGFHFIPVIRAVNEAATGTITGTVRGDTLAADPMPIGDVTITVYTGNLAASDATWRVHATGRTLENGEFRIPYLMPGNYIVRSDAPRSSPYTAGVRSGVIVARGVTTSGVDITLPTRSAYGIMMSPSSLSMAVGARDTLFVYATDSTGQSLNGAAFTWTSSNNGVATVRPREGRTSVAEVQANAAGLATIEACYNGACATGYIRVGEPPPTTSVATVTVTPSSLNMFVGDSVSIGATLRDSLGNTLTNRTVSWFSSDSATVRVIGYGTNAVLRALKVGTATIRAHSEGKEGSTSVVVLSSSAQLSARQ